MASFEKRGTGYRAVVSLRGTRQSKTFTTLREAKAWAAEIEAESNRAGRGVIAGKTGADLLHRYRLEVSPGKAGAVWEDRRCRAMAREPWAHLRLVDLSASDLTEWKTHRLGLVKPGTVLREIGLLAAVFAHAVTEWHWITQNPLDGVKRPPEPRSRQRLISDNEIAAMLSQLDYSDAMPVRSNRQIVATMFLLSLETGMRAGELHGLTWAHVHRKHAHLPETKNGDSRDVPLSTKATALIKRMRDLDDERVFPVSAYQRDTTFRTARKRGGMAGFTFHDARAVAVTRLAKVLDIHDLARMIGHRDLNSLLIYYRKTAAQIAERLG